MIPFVRAAGIAAVLSMLAACQTGKEARPEKAVLQNSAERQVFVTKKSLPAGSYVLVKDIETVELFYGSEDDARLNLAEDAFKLGADAVIEVENWFQPNGFAWAAPAAKGKAVKLKNKDVVKGVDGKWWPIPE